MGLAGVDRLPVLTPATLAASCSPYYSFLPNFLTYEISNGRLALSPPPDPVAIVSTELSSPVRKGPLSFSKGASGGRNGPASLLCEAQRRCPVPLAWSRPRNKGCLTNLMT